jgi:hypothetical protein
MSRRGDIEATTGPTIAQCAAGVLISKSSLEPLPDVHDQPLLRCVAG